MRYEKGSIDADSGPARLAEAADGTDQSMNDSSGSEDNRYALP